MCIVQLQTHPHTALIFKRDQWPLYLALVIINSLICIFTNTSQVIHHVWYLEDRDDDFELTAEMLIHGNVDDEGTLEEEEMLEELEDEGSSGELNDLQKVNCVLHCIQV